MLEKIKIAKLSELVDGEGKVVEALGRSIALFKVGDQVHAIENFCPHQGGPLAEGAIDDTVVTCPWHGWQFDVTNGKSVLGADGVQSFPVEIKGEDIFISL